MGAALGEPITTPYDEGALLADVGSLLTPAGWVNRARSVATKAVPSSLARQAGAVNVFGTSRGRLANYARRDTLLDAEDPKTFSLVKRALGPDATEGDVRHVIARHNAQLPVEKGGLGLGSANTAAERADAQYLPETVFRGMSVGKDNTAPRFLPPLAKQNLDSPTSTLGYWVGGAPETGLHYAQQAVTQRGGHPLSLPLRIRAEKLGQVPYRQTTTSIEAQAPEIERAWQVGYDALKYIPIEDPRYATYIVKDASQLRRLGAAFDPAQRHSSNLLAGVAPYAVPFGLLSGGLFGPPPDDIR